MKPSLPIKSALPIITLLLLMTFFCDKIKKTSPLKTNGCGPMGWGWLVPDHSLVTGCSFHRPCDNHDRCYGTCLEGSPNYKKDQCSDEATREKLRNECDRNLRRDIKKENENNPACGAYASLYYWAVSKFGEGAFDRTGIRSFLDYALKNPQKVNLEEIEKDLYELADSKIDFRDKRFIFDATGPKPVIQMVSRDPVPGETGGDKNKKLESGKGVKRGLKYGHIHVSGMLMNGKRPDEDNAKELNLDHRKFKSYDGKE